MEGKRVQYEESSRRVLSQRAQDSGQWDTRTPRRTLCDRKQTSSILSMISRICHRHFNDSGRCLRSSFSSLRGFVFSAPVPLTSDLQRSKAGVLSPRSERLSKILPNPKGAFGTALARLNHVQLQVAGDLDKMRRIQTAVGGSLKRYFETIPRVQVPLYLPLADISNTHCEFS
jgi:hypothetical protein